MEIKREVTGIIVYNGDELLLESDDNGMALLIDNMLSIEMPLCKWRELGEHIINMLEYT